MSGIVEWYQDAMYKRNDPRTESWFLMSGPGPLLMILVSYVYFCVSAGPRYMKDKKPYELRKVLIAYNIIQVLLSMYIVHEGLVSGWATTYNFLCQPVDYSDDPMSLRMARGVHFYLMCKLSELLDTVFFVLRKKNKQISFLHVFHHTIMPVCAWIGCRFYPNGHGTLLGLINGFIHVIMYTYYMLSSMGPHMNKYLWWKKYLTLLQVAQFLVVAVHNMLPIFTDCDYPKIIAFLLSLHAVIFTYLFLSFYVQNYVNKERRRTAPNDGGTEKLANRAKIE